MTQVQCIRTRTKGKHLTFEERQELERIMRNNASLPKKERLSYVQIAKNMGISRATLYRELARGHYETDHQYGMPLYSAIIAQMDYEHQATAKGPELKIAQHDELAQYIETMIVDQHFSPDAVIMTLEKKQR